MKLAFEKETVTESMIEQLIVNHRNSGKVELMRIGDRYYSVDNDILTKNDGDKKNYQANTKLAHAVYKNIIDEKIGYLFSKDSSIHAETDSTTDVIVDSLGVNFNYDLESLGFEASNKGIAWLHPYINEKGEFKLFVANSEQIIPGWTDSTHTDLNYVIRYYDVKVFRFNRYETVTDVEFWTKDEVTYYRLENGKLINKKTEGHFKLNNINTGWGTVPWIAFKNNRKELPDIKFVKSLVDDYDLSRSEVSNYIQEVKNLIFVLKGYSGDSLDEFLEYIYQKRAVILDADDESDVTTLNPQMDINAAKEHYEQLKKDILDSGQAVDRNLDKFGAAPSGIALEFLFSRLELKTNQLISEFSRGFNRVVDFIYLFLEKTNRSINREKVSIVFNTDMLMDETDIINNCNNSRGLVSTDTILANHPWVRDIQNEKQKLAKESFDSVELEDEK
ncbi:MAG: phage portal protein [Tissierellia bacterium]|nr:phage portal protein [Tissierellia bacterium]